MSHLRLLLALRFRLLLRQLIARRSRLASSILLVVLVTPISIGLGIGTRAITVGLLDGAPEAAVREWIHLLYLGVFVFLGIMPVLGFRGSEFYDVTKLFSYPVRQRTVFVAVSLGLLTSGSVLFWLPTLVLPVLALPGGAALTALRLVTVLVFLFLTVSIGQLLVYALLNVLRSRRFRDLVAVVGPLVAASIYLLTRFTTVEGSDWLGQLAESRPSRWFKAVPCYWITLTTGAPRGPDLGDLLPLLLGAVPLTLLVVALSSSLQEKAFLGEISLSAGTRTVPARRRGVLARLLARFVPDDLRAIAGKEVTSLRREPMVKTLLIHQSAFFVVPIVFALVGIGGGPQGDRVLRYLHLLPLMLLFVEQTLVTNSLGLEGAGLVHLLGTPIPRRRILMGKNLAHGLLFGVGNTALILAAALAAGLSLSEIGLGAALGSGVRDALAGLLGLGAILALGNLVSLLAPSRLTVKGRRALRQQQSGREGCAVALLRLISLGAVAVVLGPIVVLLYLPDLVESVGGWFFAISAPVALAYVAGLHLGSLRLGEALLCRREPRLMEIFAKSED